MEQVPGRRSESLKQYVLSQIEKKGPVPFSQFMEWCLYHSEYGYYRSEKPRIGRDGDYYTSPCVHPLFGGLIAKQLVQMAEILGGEEFDVVEMGGGEGFLCKDILDWMRTHAPSLYPRLHYRLIESAPSLLAAQKENLARQAFEGRIRWIEGEAFAYGEWCFQGCFLSNELIDAFPVHRVVVDRGVLGEIYVTQQDGRLVEEIGELSDSRIPGYLKTMGVALEEGQKAEVNLRALDWMERVAARLGRGFVLTMDYGCLAEELYAPHRRDGTLLGYSRHRITENLYERLGDQDLTSHVNFTALIRKGEEVGLTFAGLIPQYRFLLGLGFLQELESMQAEMSSLEALKLRLTLKHLIEPEAGMGEAFKVLIQHRGVEFPHLDGLKDLDALSQIPSGKGVSSWKKQSGC